MYEFCNVCGEAITRDVQRAIAGDASNSEWLGICGCPNRRWRWRSETGEAPWRLLGPPPAQD